MVLLHQTMVKGNILKHLEFWNFIFYFKIVVSCGNVLLKIATYFVNGRMLIKYEVSCLLS